MWGGWIYLRYYVRNGKFSSGSGWFSLLKNKCSVRGCGLKGHNKSNHPSTLKNALKRGFRGADVYDQLVEMNEKAIEAEESEGSGDLLDELSSAFSSLFD